MDKIKNDIPSREDLVVSMEHYPQREWKTLGKELGFKSDTLKKIQENSSDDDSRMESMLQHWLHDSPLPTWGNFEKAMNRLGENKIS